jgi:HEPN domain-containing protein
MAQALKGRKRPHPFLSRARAFWRVARKKQRNGESGDWYAFQAQQAYNQYLKSKRGAS